MPAKKKGAQGDAAKGEKTFKNLCSVCHSLSVSCPRLNGVRLILPDLLSVELLDPTLHQAQASLTRKTPHR